MPSQITVADKTAEIIEVVVPEVSEKQPSSSPPCLYATATTNRPLQQRFVLDACACAIQVQPNRKRKEEIIVPVPDEEEDTTPAEDDTSADDKTSPLRAVGPLYRYGAQPNLRNVISWKAP